jgi:hypothetical protein
VDGLNHLYVAQMSSPLIISKCNQSSLISQNQVSPNCYLFVVAVPSFLMGGIHSVGKNFHQEGIGLRVLYRYSVEQASASKSFAITGACLEQIRKEGRTNRVSLEQLIWNCMPMDDSFLILYDFQNN